MVGILSRPLDHCPSHDPALPYPSLRFKNVRRRNRYRRRETQHPSHMCCGGSYSGKISVSHMRKHVFSESEHSTSLQKKKENLDIFITLVPSTEFRESISILFHDTIGRLQNLISGGNFGLKKKWNNGYIRWQNEGIKGLHRTETITPFTSLNPYFKKLADGIHLSTDEKMVFEALRLHSFFNVKTETSALTLATAGFFASGQGNETKCYSCGITYSQWHRSDNPHLIHKRISPNCRHIQGADARNVPLSTISTTAVQSAAGHVEDNENMHDMPNSRSRHLLERALETTQNFSETTSTESGIDSGSATSNDLEITTNTDEAHDLSPYSNLVSPSTFTSLVFMEAVYPQYTESKIRLESFQLWPRDHCKKPAELVVTGFFYAGYSDCVRCFVCGVGLRTWEDEDDPWVEHVRWRSSCDFVSKVRGQDFVIQILATLGRQLTETKQSDDLLQTEACQKALSMGFSKESVTKAAEEISKSEGPGVLQLSSLLEHILALSEETPIVTDVMTTGQDDSAAAVAGCNEFDTNNENKSSSKHANDNCEVLVEKTLLQDKKTEKTKENTESISLQTAEEENQQMRESRLCKICLDETANIVFLPCGHLVACVTCSPALERCPICRQHIRGTVRVHLATMTSVKDTD